MMTIREYKANPGKNNRNFHKLSRADQFKVAREKREERRKNLK